MSSNSLETLRTLDKGPANGQSNFDVRSLLNDGHSHGLFSRNGELASNQQPSQSESSLFVHNLWDGNTPANKDNSSGQANANQERNILSISGDTAPKLTNNTFGSGSLKSASVSVKNASTVQMTESGANADEMWYSHYKDNGGNTISDQVQVTLPSNLNGVHAVEMGDVVVRNGYKDEFELQFKANGNGTDRMSYFSNNPSLGAHGGWVDAGTVPALQPGTNTIDFTGQVLNSGSDLKFTGISVNGKAVSTPAEFAAGSASGWGLAGQVDQHMQIDNNSSSAPVTTDWTVSSSQTA